jgi:hypothetical protein
MDECFPAGAGEGGPTAAVHFLHPDGGLPLAE